MTLRLIGIALYFAVIAILGFFGFRRTESAADFALARRRANPVVVGLSYGATFLSTSAIIGFGGVSAQFGLVTLWLLALNALVSVLVAISIFGVRARKLAEQLDCQTFPELLARRFGSPFLGRFVALVIIFFTPLYGAAVLIGVARVLEVALGAPFAISLLLVLVSTGLYVVAGGFRAVLYTDAFQALAMATLLPVLLWLVLSELGGLEAALTALDTLSVHLPEALRAQGMLGLRRGFTPFSPLWLQLSTSIVFAVAIGAVALPQLVVRCISLESTRQVHRSGIVAVFFLLLVLGPAFLSGAFSNALFFHADAQLAVPAAGGNIDRVIPLMIERFMPEWIAVPFMVAMLAASMSTLSSLVHVGATTMARDLGGDGRLRSMQAGAALSVLAIALWAGVLPGSIIAQATAIFFGLVASTFLPAYAIALFARAPSPHAPLAAVVVGSFVWLFWMAFGYEPHALRLGLVDASLVTGTAWAFAARVDPVIFALPSASLAAFLAMRIARKG